MYLGLATAVRLFSHTYLIAEKGRLRTFLLQITDWECGTALQGMSAHITHQLSWQHKLSLHQSRPLLWVFHLMLTDATCPINCATCLSDFPPRILKWKLYWKFGPCAKLFLRRASPFMFINYSGFQSSYFLIISLFSKLVLLSNRRIAIWSFPFGND